MSLQEMGWDSEFEVQFGMLGVEGCMAGRVVRQDRHVYSVQTSDSMQAAEVSGTFRHRAESPADFPAVGDWVAVQVVEKGGTGLIHAVVPRRTQFSRKAAGSRTDEQVIAANLDVVFLVSALDGGRAFNPRRIERYLLLTQESGAEPVIVLNKVDVCPDVEACVARAREVARGRPLYAVSATHGIGIERLRDHLGCGVTAAFLGSSGVGKSALINALLGKDYQAVGDVREDDRRGRHTTTHRELLVLPEGGLLIDTPGMRELQLWGEGEDLDGAFDDIEAFAAECHFRDCTHAGEPGCAVRLAVSDGHIEGRRLESYHDLQREMRHLASRRDQKARVAVKASEKQLGRLIKRFSKQRRIHRGEK